MVEELVAEWTAMLIIVIDTWMLDMIEVVMVIGIVMTVEMIDIGALIVLSMTGMSQTDFLLIGMGLLIITFRMDMAKTEVMTEMDPTEEVSVSDMELARPDTKEEKVIGTGLARTTDVLGGELCRLRSTIMAKVFFVIFLVFIEIFSDQLPNGFGWSLCLRRSWLMHIDDWFFLLSDNL